MLVFLLRPKGARLLRLHTAHSVRWGHALHHSRDIHDSEPSVSAVVPVIPVASDDAPESPEDVLHLAAKFSASSQVALCCREPSGTTERQFKELCDLFQAMNQLAADRTTMTAFQSPREAFEHKKKAWKSHKKQLMDARVGILGSSEQGPGTGTAPISPAKQKRQQKVRHERILPKQDTGLSSYEDLESELRRAQAPSSSNTSKTNRLKRAAGSPSCTPESMTVQGERRLPEGKVQGEGGSKTKKFSFARRKDVFFNAQPPHFQGSQINPPLVDSSPFKDLKVRYSQSLRVPRRGASLHEADLPLFKDPDSHSLPSFQGSEVVPPPVVEASPPKDFKERPSGSDAFLPSRRSRRNVDANVDPPLWEESSSMLVQNAGSPPNGSRRKKWDNSAPELEFQPPLFVEPDLEPPFGGSAAATTKKTVSRQALKIPPLFAGNPTAYEADLALLEDPDSHSLPSFQGSEVVPPPVVEASPPKDFKERPSGSDAFLPSRRSRRNVDANVDPPLWEESSSMLVQNAGSPPNGSRRKKWDNSAPELEFQPPLFVEPDLEP
eukprot:RCo047342